MGRRTKEELLASNYYEWLKRCEELRGKKARGEKLTDYEKTILSTVPDAENPYSEDGEPDPPALPTGRSATAAPEYKAPVEMKDINFGKDAVFDVRGGHFLCPVFSLPYTDNQCLLWCERKDCPFNQKGYFRSKGVKF